MKIATYNVNGISSRLPVLLRWLEERKPDVVCLQELKAPQERFPEEAIASAGYRAIWHGQKSWNGVAVMTRDLPMTEVRRALPGNEEDVHSRYLEVKIDRLTLSCLYLPNGNPAPGPKFDYKLEWFERLIKHSKRLAEQPEPAILTGDFNVIPTEKDVYKPERWIKDALFREETREAFGRLMDQGWTDALRFCHPDETLYTYWDYFRNAYGRDAGLRIDHFLLNPAIAGNIKGSGVDKDVRGWEKSSDHAPVWLELDTF